MYSNAKRVMRRNLSLETDFGLPLFMVKNAEIAIDKLSPYTSKCDVAQSSLGNFTVTMEADEPGELEAFSVYFGNELNFPSCTCNDWKTNSLPCQHMFAVFLKYDQYNYTSLSSIYRSNPIFDLDYCCLRKVGTESVSKSISTQTDNSVFKKLMPFDSISLGKIKKLRNALKSTASLFSDKSMLERISSDLMNMERNFTNSLKTVNANTMKNLASYQLKKICNSGSSPKVGPGLGKVIPASSITIPSYTQQQHYTSSNTLPSNDVDDNTLQNPIGFIQRVQQEGDPSASATPRPESLAATESVINNQSDQSYKIVLQSDKLSTLSPHDIVNQLKQSIKLRGSISPATTTTASSTTSNTASLQEHAQAIIMSLNGKENDKNIAENVILNQHQEEAVIQAEYENVPQNHNVDEDTNLLMNENHETVNNIDNDNELSATATDLSVVGSLLLGLGSGTMTTEIHDGRKTAAMVTIGQKRKITDHDGAERDAEIQSETKKSNLNED